MPGINDVIDKLDDILDKIEDVKEKVGEVEGKVDTIIARNELWQICPVCSGTGQIEYRDDNDPTPKFKVCTKCNGNKKIKFGTQEIPE